MFQAKLRFLSISCINRIWYTLSASCPTWRMHISFSKRTFSHVHGAPSFFWLEFYWYRKSNKAFISNLLLSWLLGFYNKYCWTTAHQHFICEALYHWILRLGKGGYILMSHMQWVFWRIQVVPTYDKAAWSWSALDFPSICWAYFTNKVHQILKLCAS